MKVGTRIYYTGDMANSEDYGEVIKFVPADKWGSDYVDIRLEDGRIFYGVYLASFNPGPGQRFYLAEEWERKRQEKIEAFKNSMKK